MAKSFQTFKITDKGFPELTEMPMLGNAYRFGKRQNLLPQKRKTK